MLIEVKVPQLSESVSEATLVTWHKKEGEAVSRDENLIDIETDKVVLETPAPADGVLVKIIKGDGDTVASGDLIAQIDTEAKASAGAAPAASASVQAVTPPPAAATSSAAGAASPAARKILDEKGVSAADVSGTGRGGRVTKEDAVGAQPKAAAAAAVAPAVVATGDRAEERVPMTRLRARIAERLLQSKNENAILTTFNEVNMAPVMALRKQYGEKFEKAHGVRLGFMGFFVKAAVAALKKYPILNASVDGNDIVYHGYIDIGIAVGSPRGLVVPILRNVESMSVADIEKKIAEFGQKAKDGKLSLEELTGGTFSISNGGVFGSMMSTPIINPPQSAILGIHATKDRAVVENGQVVVRPINYLAMSYDHRIIDGREAVLGLVAMKEAMEDPARLILDV
ncbi:MAG: dihydrolipoyllysine-residue succinyltransferase [Betaproteobacteria bacterium HGW-Betaproteobacteria-13]|jgi:2-oxoglutarate dehydrogenase E2 component (dihydrolipoamide succinyltransferase)|uniref:Dihydrolipoyllysine-residue succinyltransferase component of 2-oxoglutarate dehydrogenase complex n=1 Tax=Parazoarcus communis TaxID=41977 RepID=A0A2U8H394_9RHOO|nr:2-oxoglutarate dehydrogenase complex dihydrolipoyllysine-residue succinyltransferase [Parazoarcus communis]AWI80422.1 dihydrolipoyllysine-residue succinyltransferase [Parazoarcus communis]PKO79331.1 MAG: dihydrolipoyllysine-residue succinyltransferase [Betaproteobacteria bacterium HGW-Betaproteobacteria-13]